jgi:enoyl-CoA hydratase/carnithine racemase
LALFYTNKPLVSALIGRGKAFEYILSGIDVDAPTAEKIGWINKAFDTSADLHSFVDSLANRIALFELDAIAAAKRSINDASRPLLDKVIVDGRRFGVLLATPETQTIIQKFLVATNNQTNGTFEFNLGAEVPTLYQ